MCGLGGAGCQLNLETFIVTFEYRVATDKGQRFPANCHQPIASYYKAWEKGNFVFCSCWDSWIDCGTEKVVSAPNFSNIVFLQTGTVNGWNLFLPRNSFDICMYKILFPTRRQFNNSFSKVQEGENISSTVNKETEMLSFLLCYLCLRLNATSVLSSCRPLTRGASNQRFTTGGRNFYKNIATGES